MVVFKSKKMYKLPKSHQVSQVSVELEDVRTFGGKLLAGKHRIQFNRQEKAEAFRTLRNRKAGEEYLLPLGFKISKSFYTEIATIEGFMQEVFHELEMDLLKAYREHEYSKEELLLQFDHLEQLDRLLGYLMQQTKFVQAAQESGWERWFWVDHQKMKNNYPKLEKSAIIFSIAGNDFRGEVGSPFWLGVPAVYPRHDPTAIHKAQQIWVFEQLDRLGLMPMPPHPDAAYHAHFLARLSLDAFDQFF
jgi:hypothetical protein